MVVLSSIQKEAKTNGEKMELYSFHREVKNTKCGTISVLSRFSFHREVKQT